MQIIPIVMTSAFGSGSLKKSPDAVFTRSDEPSRAIALAAIGSTAGKSNDTQRICGCLFATRIESRPLAPPTSHNVWYLEKSTLSARALKVSRENLVMGSDELLESLRLRVQRSEDRFLTMFNFVVWLSRL